MVFSLFSQNSLLSWLFISLYTEPPSLHHIDHRKPPFEILPHWLLSLLAQAQPWPKPYSQHHHWGGHHPSPPPSPLSVSLSLSFFPYFSVLFLAENCLIFPFWFCVGLGICWIGSCLGFERNGFWGVYYLGLWIWVLWFGFEGLCWFLVGWLDSSLFSFLFFFFFFFFCFCFWGFILVVLGGGHH